MNDSDNTVIDSDNTIVSDCDNNDVQDHATIYPDLLRNTSSL